MKYDTCPECGLPDNEPAYIDTVEPDYEVWYFACVDCGHDWEIGWYIPDEGEDEIEHMND